MLKTEILRLTVGQMGTNCYLLFRNKSRKALIIDPGDDADYIVKTISDLKLLPVLIIATHGHFDHIMGITHLKLIFNIPFLIHAGDEFLLKQMNKSARYFLGIEAGPSPQPDGFFKKTDVLKLDGIEVKALETPGHTPGGICLYIADIRALFCGDLIFSDGVGRTDFSYSNPEDLKKSVERVSKLPPDTVLYPGHGDSFALGERRSLFETIESRRLN